MEPQLTDRERILSIIIRSLYSVSVFGKQGSVRWGDEHYGPGDVYFAPWAKPVKGDLVMASTGPVDMWKFAIYDHYVGNGNHVVRDLASEMLCNYGNESFTVIRGLSEIDLLYGGKLDFYRKVLKAFQRGTHSYIYRFGGIHFEENEAVISIRERFALSAGSTPFRVRLKWTKKTSIATILSAMTEGGYGTHKFGTPV